MKNLLKILLSIFAFCLFTFAVIEPLNMAGNWYQQFMPNLNGRQINDITFIDSLNGFAVASRNVNPDTASILRTTNGGDNWQIVFTETPKRFYKIKFINITTGFAAGGSGGGTAQFYKTTNSGTNWFLVSSFGCSIWRDMHVLNNDTIWLVDDNSLCGGVYMTTNGGSSWQQQLNIGSANPNRIYMVNARIGFIAEDAGYLRKTTNSGVNWTLLTGVDGFYDMCFADTLTGWKCVPGDSSVRKTTNGGINWYIQQIPTGGMLVSSQIVRFSFINRDTIWGVGGAINYGGVLRGILFKTTNGGINWGFQIPDTSFGIGAFGFVKFIDKNYGWAIGRLYNSQIYRSIHTTNGGDTTFYFTGVQQISTEVPKDYKLFQNYPNPFNPKTLIRYQLTKLSDVKLIIYDIQGKAVSTLIDDKQPAGIYEADFNASSYSSGIYFYNLTVNTGKEVFTDTKKMMLLK